MAKRVHKSNVRGIRRRRTPRKCWMDGVKKTLERKGLNIEEAKVIPIFVRRAVGEYPA